MSKPRYVQFTLPIEPVAKGRPRFGNGRTYTPKATERFEHAVATWTLKHAGCGLLQGPLKLTVGFIVKMPKRPKFKEPAVRPDLDNYIKALTDGMNGLLYADDAQICEITACKVYDLTGAGPRINVKLEEMS